MHFDLFDFEEQLRDIKERMYDFDNKVGVTVELNIPNKSKLEKQGIEILERLNKLYIIAFVAGVLTFTLPLLRKYLIPTSTLLIIFSCIFQLIFGIITGSSIALIVINLMEKSKIIKQLSELENKPKQKKPYNNKKNYTTVSNTKIELENLIRSLPHNEEGKQAKIIIDKCLNILDRITSLQEILKVILERSDEYSLEEVISTIKQAGEKIGTNIFNITNRLALELNIDGFETTQIQKYLDNNEDIMSECTKLAKESLNYIESKSNLSGSLMEIESLTETIQKLKKLNEIN